jgi:hypothetical protein
MKCDNCGEECWRDEVDIGVGYQNGPWRCDNCGWYEGCEADAAIDNDGETVEEGDKHLYRPPGASDK